MVVLEFLDKAAAARCTRFRAWGGENQGFHSEWAMHTLRAAIRAAKSSTTFVGLPSTFDLLSSDERRDLSLTITWVSFTLACLASRLNSCRLWCFRGKVKLASLRNAMKNTCVRVFPEEFVRERAEPEIESGFG